MCLRYKQNRQRILDAGFNLCDYEEEMLTRWDQTPDVGNKVRLDTLMDLGFERKGFIQVFLMCVVLGSCLCFLMFQNDVEVSGFGQWRLFRMLDV